MNLLGALLIVLFGALFVTVSSRLTGEIGSTSNPISGMTIATLMLTCLVFLIVGWTGGAVLRHRAVRRRHRLHRLLQWRHHLAGPEDRLPGRRHAAGCSSIAILIGAFASALLMGPILLKLNDNATVYVPIAQVAPQGLATDVAALGEKRESLTGLQAKDDSAQLPRLAQDRPRRRPGRQVSGG